MNRLVRTVLIIAVLTALAAAFGGWIGVRIGVGQSHERAGLDAVVHDRLQLTGSQKARLGVLESAFAARRRALEIEMDAANSDLAAAIGSEHTYGPRARRAVARFHIAMSALQEETIRHVLAMRGVMTPDQARRFDRLIDKALRPSSA